MADVRTTTLPDAETVPEAPPSPTHVAIRREDYRPPEWLVPEIGLKFTLGIETTRVQSKLLVQRNAAANSDTNLLRLNGDGLKPAGVWIDGECSDTWTMDGGDLLIELPGQRHEIGIDTEISPQANTKLMGLYASGGMLCTQCEAEGFRRITFFPDRPDVLSKYKVRMEADAARFPVLLANGNLVASGEADGGRHWAEWEDPFPKPCYLFALVAGDLKANRDSFTTLSGRKVDLAIWVREADLPKTAHAMASLKAAMAWDEKVYGREYDLDLFNIVAVSDFNMGAMENKGLNIFNSAYVLADQETATDADFDNIARVVAHEYFHNWSGDRVTCRDWFQLSLKEGFTVFRDQSFSADMGSAPVKRIEDVRVLRAAQFPEDAGPLAHPVRPDSYIEISNFYTATVYNKGAELIRMLALVLGAEKYRAGTDLYFERHDGEAATCDDFVKALEDASGVDLTPFKIWYSQAGTPKVKARLEHDAAAKTVTLHLEQRIDPTPGQPIKQPMPIPLKTALIGETSGHEICPERLIVLDQPQATVTFDNVVEPPLLSINRNFSAPIIVEAERGAGHLERLAQTDTDPFARFEAMQELMMRSLLAGARGEEADAEPVIRAVEATLKSNSLDAAFKAEAIILPGEAMIADRLDVVDPDAIHESREELRKYVLKGVGRAAWRDIWQTNADPKFDLSPMAKGRRRLKNVALGYLMAEHTEYSIDHSYGQYRKSTNMTDRLAALGLLASSKFHARTMALEDFYERFHADPLVLDKWFAIQAAAQQPEVIDLVLELSHHPDFTITNPNRLRALAGTFGANHWVFHSPDGRGYEFLAEMILDADKINPQVAARLVPPLGRWRRYEPRRSEMMRAALQRIAATAGLSKDVFEQVTKSLA